jgi:dTDP-3,4-didehydro-2,6-dideoxy-alpha-D-glucose 3-reductase
MKILILGFSYFVKNRILPSLFSLPELKIDIASESRSESIPSHKNIGRVFNQYDCALSESKADIVYVSTVNSTHAELAEKALRKGLHVIVDKPAFINHDDALRLTDLAEKRKVCLAESIIYGHHEQVSIIKGIFKEASEPKRLTAAFSFPAMNPENFRYRRDLGGGALWDLGPYAVSVGRIFFDAYPEEIFTRICSRGGKDNVDNAFCIMSTYPNGCSMVGHFGFDTIYKNYLNILGVDVSVSLNRIFTTPPDLINEIQIRHLNENYVINVGASDNFINFFKSLVEAIASNTYHQFNMNLIADSYALHRLRLSAQEDRKCQ